MILACLIFQNTMTLVCVRKTLEIAKTDEFRCETRRFYDTAFSANINRLNAPKANFYLHYRGVDYWPPKNFRRHYRFRFYFLELPIRWIFKGVFPQNYDHSRFRTFFDEDIFIDNYFEREGRVPTHFVDIGAGDGIDMSNTFKLVERGLTGLAVEGSPLRFSQLSLTYEKYTKVKLVRSYVSATSVNSLINGAETPNDFDVLNLDIDSYDYYILESILGEFNPKLCVLEWNRSYPSSIFFTVKNDPNIHWDSTSELFQGASLLAFLELLQKFNYKVICIQGAALFAVPANSSPSWAKLSALDAWSQYLNGPSKWVATESVVLKMNKENQLMHFKAGLANFDDGYILY